MNHFPSIPLRWRNRAVVGLFIIFVLVSNYVLIQQERDRAIRGECQAVNVAIERIRIAVVKVAGYQSLVNPNASEELREQVRVGNIRRQAFAEDRAQEIPSLRCPGDPAPKRGSTTTVIPTEPE